MVRLAAEAWRPATVLLVAPPAVPLPVAGLAWSRRPRPARRPGSTSREPGTPAGRSVGGRVSFRSTPYRGTEFTLWLPVRG